MIPELRKNFNSNFSEKTYNNFLEDLNSVLKYPADFRVCETPLFLTRELTDELVKACDDIITQLQQETFLQKSENAIPQNLKVPNDSEHPPFLQIDFAITKNGEAISSKIN